MCQTQPGVHHALSIPGIGLLTATALVAATSGDVSHFQDARHFSSWFGLTPRSTAQATVDILALSPRRGSLLAHVVHPRGQERAARPRWPMMQVERSAVCGAGRWMQRAATITRRHAHWPTSWRGFAMPRCATRCRLVRRPCGYPRRSAGRVLRCRRECQHPKQPLSRRN